MEEVSGGVKVRSGWSPAVRDRAVPAKVRGGMAGGVKAVLVLAGRRREAMMRGGAFIAWIGRI